MIEEILLISDINFTSLIMSGFYVGLIISVSIVFIAQGLNYCLKLLSRS